MIHSYSNAVYRAFEWLDKYFLQEVEHIVECQVADFLARTWKDPHTGLAHAAYKEACRPVYLAWNGSIQKKIKPVNLTMTEKTLNIKKVSTKHVMLRQHG